jgi:hypothetical protein
MMISENIVPFCATEFISFFWFVMFHINRLRKNLKVVPLQILRVKKWSAVDLAVVLYLILDDKSKFEERKESGREESQRWKSSSCMGEV